jgi:hypothetical protein
MRQSGADPGPGVRGADENAIEDLEFIEMFALCLEELATVIDLRLYDRIVVAGEGDVRTVGFEKILVDVEPWAERFERCLKTLHCVFLARVVETLIVNSRDAEHHAHVATLCQKRGLVPEAVEVDVVIE